MGTDAKSEEENTRDIFDFLCKKVQNFSNYKSQRSVKAFSVHDDNKQFQIIFRYCETDLGDIFPEKLRSTAISQNADLNNISSLTFDVIGLDDDYITEMRLEKDNDIYAIYFTPTRDQAKIKLLKKIFLSMIEIEN
ncbi:MAG: hypothetical protein ACYDAO_05145 [Thermoplasmataceae archaeon]